jgi:hypothetical protein
MFLRFLRLLGEDGIVKKPGETRGRGQGSASKAFQKKAPVNEMLVGAALAGRQG